VTCIRKMLLLIALPLALPACHHRETDPAHAATQTIAPAAAQPAPNGTDATTQTVDVEDSRSEAEGGTATAPAPAPASPAKKAPKKKR